MRPLVGFVLAASLGLACKSSAPYGSAAHAAVGTGAMVAGAAVVRASGGCWAECLPGTVCNHENGLCERAEARPTPVATALPTAAPVAPAAPPAPRPGPLKRASAPYPPGHEYVVPPLPSPAKPAPTADAGCAPPASSDADAGALTCE